MGSEIIPEHDRSTDTSPEKPGEIVWTREEGSIIVAGHSPHVEIWEHFFTGVWPTNAYVEVSALAEPGLNAEITATAILDDD